MVTIFLLDDERVFADNRSAIIARNVDEAIEKADSLTHIDELWLDYVLTFGDTIPFLQYLVKRNCSSNVLTVGKVIFHSSAYAAHSLIAHYASQAGLPEVELPEIIVTPTHIG